MSLLFIPHKIGGYLTWLYYYQMTKNTVMLSECELDIYVICDLKSRKCMDVYMLVYKVLIGQEI